MTRFTIIVPIYNVEKFLEECISSVINQTYGNFQLLLVDDGSIDNSGVIADSYAKKDKRVEVIHKQNGGLSDARNAGLSYAKGTHVVFLDGDDYWDLNLLENLNNSLIKIDADVTIFGYKVNSYNESNELIRSTIQTEDEKVIYKKTKKNETINNYNLLGYAWNKVYRTSIIEKHYLRFLKGTSYIEDCLFNADMFQYADSVSFVAISGYNYRQRLDTLGRKYYDNIHELDQKATLAFESILKSCSVSDDRIDVFFRENTFNRARWSASIIANTADIDRAQKSKLIKQIMNDTLDVGIPAVKSNSARLYKYLFKRGMVGSLLFIENYRANNLKRYVLDRMSTSLKGKIIYRISKKSYELMPTKSQKKVILTLVPDHGNVGDLALGYAQLEFFKNYFPEYTTVEVPLKDTYAVMKQLKKNVNNDDIIAITGGGDLGTLYPDVEEQRQFIIKTFPQNSIISFPQSVYFEESAWGDRALKVAKNVYKRHKKLILLAREVKSFERMKEIFPHNHAYLTPDIALYLNEATDTDRNDKLVTLSIRKDKESSMSAMQKEQLIESLKSAGLKIRIQDTHLGSVASDISQRPARMEKVFNSFRSSGLVITDRLHGMIFCAITRTPCIALNNNNGKVSGVYSKWLKNLNHIVMYDDFSDIALFEQAVKKLIGTNKKNLPAPKLEEPFTKMASIIKEEIR